MRSAEQIRRTPRQWADHKAAQRSKTLGELLAMLRRARDEGAEWYVWVASGGHRK